MNQQIAAQEELERKQLEESRKMNRDVEEWNLLLFLRISEKVFIKKIFNYM
jgi:hypothetical protein